MNDNHINIVNSHHVEGWLMDVPGYREDYQHEALLTKHNDIESPIDDNGKERPLSMASIGSEDSVNLDELINANFTTDMDDETDLPFLSSLDLDDSKEDFWKIDATLDDHLLSEKKKQKDFHSIYYSSKKAAENEYLNTLSYSPPSSYKNDDFINGPSSVTIPSKLQVPRSALPVSPKSISSSEGSSSRRDRSGSFSSENSLNSQSTITTNSLFHLRHNIYPSESTSTSSSHSTTTTSGFLSRSHTTSSVKSENSNIRLPQKLNKVPMVPSLSDYNRNNTCDDYPLKNNNKKQQQPLQRTGLARRATHIPAPSSSTTTNQFTKLQTMPSRTKSTCVLPKQDRSVSRIGQPSSLLQKRASHIPTPASTRSNSSLGHVSIFASSTKTTTTSRNEIPSRPKTSMATPVRSPSSLTGRRSNLRTPIGRIATKKN